MISSTWGHAFPTEDADYRFDLDKIAFVEVRAR